MASCMRRILPPPPARRSCWPTAEETLVRSHKVARTGGYRGNGYCRARERSLRTDWGRRVDAKICAASIGGLASPEKIRGVLGELLDCVFSFFSLKQVLEMVFTFSWRCSEREILFFITMGPHKETTGWTGSFVGVWYLGHCCRTLRVGTALRVIWTREDEVH